MRETNMKHPNTTNTEGATYRTGRIWNLERPIPQRRKSDKENAGSPKPVGHNMKMSDLDSPDIMVRLKTMFFKVSTSGDYVFIESTGVHGAFGKVQFHKNVHLDILKYYDLHISPIYSHRKTSGIHEGKEVQTELQTNIGDTPISDRGHYNGSDTCFLLRRESHQVELHIRSTGASKGKLNFGFPEMESLQWQAFQKTRLTVEQLLKQLKETPSEQSTDQQDKQSQPQPGTEAEMTKVDVQYETLKVIGQLDKWIQKETA